MQSSGRGTYANSSGFKVRNAKTTGVLANASNGSISNIGVSSVVSSAVGTDNYGVKVEANIKGQNNYGMYSNLVGSTVAGSVNYGIYSAASVATGTLAGFFNGAIVSTGSGTFSDKSIKKDIKQEENILLKLQMLNPVNYTFIQEKERTGLNLPTTLQHGFIAQEIEKVFPELVMDVVNPIYNDKSELIGKKDLKAVNYIGLISVLTSSIKELNEVVIKDLKNEIQLLKDALSTKEEQSLKNSEIKVSNSNYFLGQNTPNPFSNSTIIEYSLPINEKNASIILFDLSGKTIKEYKLNKPKDAITINQGELQKGMYIYSLISNNSEITSKKMIVN